MKFVGNFIFNKIFTVQLGIFKFAGVEKSLCGT